MLSDSRTKPAAIHSADLITAYLSSIAPSHFHSSLMTLKPCLQQTSLKQFPSLPLHRTSLLNFLHDRFERTISQVAASPSTSYGQCSMYPHSSQRHANISWSEPSQWWHDQHSAQCMDLDVAKSVCVCSSLRMRCCITLASTYILFQPHWELYVHIGLSHTTIHTITAHFSSLTMPIWPIWPIFASLIHHSHHHCTLFQPHYAIWPIFVLSYHLSSSLHTLTLPGHWNLQASHNIPLKTPLR